MVTHTPQGERRSEVYHPSPGNPGEPDRFDTSINLMEQKTLSIYVDGSCFNMPGMNTAGYAAIISDKHNPEKDEDVLEAISGWFSEATNNKAEWAAMVAAAMLMNEWGKIYPDAIFNVYGDSQLVVQQALRVFRVRNIGLMPYSRAFFAVMRHVRVKHAILWVPRKMNKLADIYSKKANPYHNPEIKELYKDGTTWRSACGIRQD